MKNAIPMTLVALFWGAIENIANISRVFTQLPTRGRCSRYQQSPSLPLSILHTKSWPAANHKSPYIFCQQKEIPSF